MTDRPSVVVFVVDALRADYVSPYDESGETPAIESLADEGTVFRRAISPAPWTLPSVTSLLTGLDPHEHGATSREFGTHAATLVDDLSAAGYRCVHLSPTTWVGEWLPQGRGFDRVEEFTGPTHRYFDAGADVRDLSEGVARGPAWYATVLRRSLRSESPLASLGNALAFKYTEATGDAWRDDVRASETAAERFDDVLDDLAGEEKPFFAYVHLMDPHLPLYVPPEFESDARPPGCDSREDEHAYMRNLMDDIWAVRTGQRTLSTGEQDFLRARYADAVSYADRALGRMLDGLADRGLDDEALVAVTGDHGEHLGELVDGRTLLDHQRSVRLPLLRVPLVVRSPERFGDREAPKVSRQTDGAGGREVDDLVQPHYLAETVRALAGLDHDPDRTLLPGADRRSTALAEYRGVVPSHPPAEYESDELFRRRLSAVEGEWKLDVVGSRRRAARIDWDENEAREVSPASIPGDVRESLEEALSAATEGGRPAEGDAGGGADEAGRYTEPPDGDGPRALPGEVERRLDDLGYR